MTNRETTLARTLAEISRLERREDLGHAIPKKHLRHLKRKAAELRAAVLAEG